MNQLLPFAPYLAIKQLLLNRLQAALALYISDISTLNNERGYHISLYRAQGERQFLYVSAIALQLSAAKNIPAVEIATALATLIRSSSLGQNAFISQEFTVQVLPPGLIHLEITQPLLAAWLQNLVQKQWSNGEIGRWRELHFSSTFLSNTSRLFAVQYAHARCCSLLRMAAREGLITLQSPPTFPFLFNLLTPDPIPWLTSDYKLRLCHISELALLSQLLKLLDDLYCPSPSLVDWEKAALNLSQAFQVFYSSLRIWGEVKIQLPNLAQARLGLVLATQSVLRLLLQDLFAVPAPLEL